MLYDNEGNQLPLFDRHGQPQPFLRQGEAPHASPLTDPFTRYGVQPVGGSGYGDPVFSDEFRTGVLDETKWLPWYPDHPFWASSVPGGHKTNSNEPQGYDPSGISFDADGMVLTMRQEETVAGLDYTSGMVCSYPSFNPIYGYFEARMKLSNTGNAWPAFWMFPTDHSWPPEIDIMENDGKAAWNLQTYHTFHYPNPASSYPPGGNTSSVAHYTNDVGNDFHVFGARWEPGRIRWYVDGEQVKDLTIPTNYASKQMFLICNFAGAKNSIPQVPASIKVDYIRAWGLPS